MDDALIPRSRSHSTAQKTSTPRKTQGPAARQPLKSFRQRPPPVTSPRKLPAPRQPTPLPQHIPSSRVTAPKIATTSSRRPAPHPPPSTPGWGMPLLHEYPLPWPCPCAPCPVPFPFQHASVSFLKHAIFALHRSIKSKLMGWTQTQVGKAMDGLKRKVQELSRSTPLVPTVLEPFSVAEFHKWTSLMKWRLALLKHTVQELLQVGLPYHGSVYGTDHGLRSCAAFVWLRPSYSGRHEGARERICCLLLTPFGHAYYCAAGQPSGRDHKGAAEELGRGISLAGKTLPAHVYMRTQKSIPRWSPRLAIAGGHTSPHAG